MSSFSMNSILEHNRRAWDERVRQRLHHTQPATDKVFRDPVGMADVYGWVGRDLTGKRVLCLGAGGGRHGPVYAAAGARVTVVDLSSAMLELDRAVAAERSLPLRTVQASMDDLSGLEPASFELVVQPVSTCYVADAAAVYRQVARVLVAGGCYVSQHKQPVNLQTTSFLAQGRYVIAEPYYRSGPLPPVADGCLHREPGCLEFLHRWEDLLGGLCRSGFVIEDVIEPRHADPAAAEDSFGHRACFIPPYVAVKARRTSEPDSSCESVRLWTPGGA
jgi:SAM-dependent methyltransferase